MNRDPLTNGFAATILFMIFLFLLARHIRKLRPVEEPELPTVNPSAVTLPPPYTMEPPPTYSEAVKMGAPAKY